MCLKQRDGFRLGIAMCCEKRVDVGRDRSPIRKRVDVGSDRSLAFIVFDKDSSKNGVKRMISHGAGVFFLDATQLREATSDFKLER